MLGLKTQLEQVNIPVKRVMNLLNSTSEEADPGVLLTNYIGMAYN